MKGPWAPAGDLAGELHEAAGRRELERGEGEPPRQEGERQPGAEGVRQPATGGADSAARRAELPRRPGRAASSCGSTTPTATSSGWASRAPCTSSWRAAGSRRRISPGPWTFATPTLPADFKKIPLEHDRSRVLASVPGTPQAAEAILLAQIPQTARVSKTLQAPEVDVSGRRARVPADREDHGAAGGQHGQGHPEGRRPLLHVLPGRVVHVDGRRPGRGR